MAQKSIPQRVIPRLEVEVKPVSRNNSKMGRNGWDGFFLGRRNGNYMKVDMGRNLKNKAGLLDYTLCPAY